MRSASSRLMTLQQIGDEYGIPYSTGRDLVVRGVLARVTLPGVDRLMVLRADVERLIEASTERL